MTNKNAVYFETIPLSVAKVLSVIFATNGVFKERLFLISIKRAVFFNSF